MAGIVACTFAMAIEVAPTSEADACYPIAESSAALVARIFQAPTENQAEPDARAERLLRDAIAANAISETDRSGVVAVARTIARLDGIADAVHRIHIAEAISYSPRLIATRQPDPVIVAKPPLPPITEPTKAGAQFVIPGCEKDQRRGPAQLSLW